MAKADEYGRSPVYGVPTGPRQTSAALSSGDPPKQLPPKK